MSSTLTAAYIAIGVDSAYRKFPELVDKMLVGQLDVVDTAIEWAGTLDSMFDPARAEGVFAYEVAEPFGFEYAKAMLHHMLPEPRNIAARLIAAYQPDREGERLRRIEAALKACEGISTQQLERMAAVSPGALTTAYDVCSVIWEDWGKALTEDHHEIPGADAVDTLCRVGPQIREVVAWALGDACAEDAVHPMESAR